ncbi:MAG: pirin family protein [Flavitalea sp.]
MNKSILHILHGKEKSIGEETILQPLPHKDFRFASPFIVIHHLPPRKYLPDSPPERIHPHPHRGFAPVTFLFQGEGYHKDSLGNSGILKEGEVQWMFAGKGLLHSEGPSKDFLKRGGVYEFVQLWINVPAKEKMGEPYYQTAKVKEMPSVADEGVELKIASGSFDDLQGPISSFTPITSLFGKMNKSVSKEFKTSEGYWTLLYLLYGKLKINNDQVLESQQLAVFSKEGDAVTIEALTDSKILYLSGEPIDEPVAAKGNIVMNTAEEVTLAEKDYADGKFGELEE